MKNKYVCAWFIRLSALPFHYGYACPQVLENMVLFICAFALLMTDFIFLIESFIECLQETGSAVLSNIFSVVSCSVIFQVCITYKICRDCL